MQWYLAYASDRLKPQNLSRYGEAVKNIAEAEARIHDLEEMFAEETALSKL
jgi:hypothetical protein